jgi:hypothetical protein
MGQIVGVGGGNRDVRFGDDGLCGGREDETKQGDACGGERGPDGERTHGKTVAARTAARIGSPG